MERHLSFLQTSPQFGRSDRCGCFVNKVAVLCNSKLMKNQMDRLAGRSVFRLFFRDDALAGETEALEYLCLRENWLLRHP